MMTTIKNVSINITEADLVDINTSIQKLQTKLLPYLVTLSPAERKGLARMGDKSVGFVQKTQEYCKQNPELVPQFLDVDGLNIDVQTFEQIRSLYQPLLQITDSLWDTMTLTGSEAYSASLQFYNSVKNATKSKAQKAGTIYNDLSARFPGRPKKNTSVPNVTAVKVESNNSTN